MRGVSGRSEGVLTKAGWMSVRPAEDAGLRSSSAEHDPCIAQLPRSGGASVR